MAITPDNLISLYQLTAAEQGRVLRKLGYESTQGPYDYFLKSDEDAADWQTIATQSVRAEVFSISWVSTQQNDRLAEFRRLGNEAPMLIALNRVYIF